MVAVPQSKKNLPAISARMRVAKRTILFPDIVKHGSLINAKIRARTLNIKHNIKQIKVFLNAEINQFNTC